MTTCDMYSMMLPASPKLTARPMLALKGAYDRVHRLWQALQRLGVHGPMLAALQSMYKDSGLTININGRSGKTVLSQGVKQGCLLSPTLFGLYIDGMHRFLMAGPVDAPVLSSGVQVTDLAYADAWLL